MAFRFVSLLCGHSPAPGYRVGFWKHTNIRDTSRSASHKKPSYHKATKTVRLLAWLYNGQSPCHFRPVASLALTRLFPLLGQAEWVKSIAPGTSAWIASLRLKFCRHVSPPIRS